MENKLLILKFAIACETDKTSLTKKLHEEIFIVIVGRH